MKKRLISFGDYLRFHVVEPCADGLPVATEEARYGLRLMVVVLPAHPLLRTAAALRVVGPGAFGFTDVEYIPIGPYVSVDPIPPCDGGVTAA